MNKDEVSVLNNTRISQRFAKLKSDGRKGLVTFITAGDPNLEICASILEGLPEAGADFIELGMPFSDPMADGPIIQASSERALKAGASVKKTLGLVNNFRVNDKDTPIILMGYYNPIYQYGVEKFLDDARIAGVDGLIIVDLPPEEDAELCIPANEVGIDFIRLATPTTDSKRLPKLLNHASGFIYYVSIAGVTGTASAKQHDLEEALLRIRQKTDLPIAIGFGIKTPEDVAKTAEIADAVVVGSAIIKRVTQHIDDEGNIKDGIEESVLGFVKTLSSALR